jgi:hypothetical protein
VILFGSPRTFSRFVTQFLFPITSNNRVRVSYHDVTQNKVPGFPASIPSHVQLSALNPSGTLFKMGCRGESSDGKVRFSSVQGLFSQNAELEHPFRFGNLLNLELRFRFSFRTPNLNFVFSSVQVEFGPEGRTELPQHWERAG